ncbi:MAG: rhodanese-like domain-containing protein, partial [Bryobacteraceae bacterium]
AQISAMELQDRIAGGEGIQIVDVRNPGEWATGHIARAHLKPLGKFTATLAPVPDAGHAFFAGLDPAQPVAVHCKTGYRSAIAASLLERVGFTTVVNVLGGFDAWRLQKLPMEVPGPAGNAQSTAQAGKIS